MRNAAARSEERPSTDHPRCRDLVTWGLVDRGLVGPVGDDIGLARRWPAADAPPVCGGVEDRVVNGPVAGLQLDDPLVERPPRRAPLEAAFTPEGRRLVASPELFKVNGADHGHDDVHERPRPFQPGPAAERTDLPSGGSDERVVQIREALERTDHEHRILKLRVVGELGRPGKPLDPRAPTHVVTCT